MNCFKMIYHPYLIQAIHFITGCIWWVSSRQLTGPEEFPNSITSA